MGYWVYFDDYIPSGGGGGGSSNSGCGCGSIMFIVAFILPLLNGSGFKAALVGGLIVGIGVHIFNPFK